MSPPSGSLPSFSTRHSLPLHFNSTAFPYFPHLQQLPQATLEWNYLHALLIVAMRENGLGVCGSVQELSCTPLPSQDKALKKYFMMEYYVGLKNNFKDDQVQLAY